jgi:23S rRNA pseudouridine1911/1915/1917 synthase
VRLDVALAARAEVPSRAAAQRLADQGRARVDGSVRPKGHRLSPGEEVTVELEEPAAGESEGAVPFEVVLEDEHLLVVDKPGGVVVHPVRGRGGPTLAGALAGRARGGPDATRQGIVHRLDRDTSGLMLVAKSEETWRRLQQMVRERQVGREYLALVAGRPSSRSGTIDAPLGRDRRRRTVRSSRTDRPRDARTHFELVEALPHTSLLRVRLETGRTHQIRAHLAAIGHPVCGDRDYGGGACADRLGLTRQFLHATRLTFRHPVTGELTACESKPPADLRRALDVARREPVSGGPDGD